MIRKQDATYRTQGDAELGSTPLDYGSERPVARGKFLYCGDRKLVSSQ